NKIKQLMKNLPNGIWRVIWRAFKSITRKNKYFNKKFLTPISWFSSMYRLLSRRFFYRQKTTFLYRLVEFMGSISFSNFG
ncbi:MULTISPECIES: hypothetical protein, partial [unclassified Mesobacillus]|uniref:hypothetical protein n=1 Tax=unclassified Mesobacillus TaxID=2675270 RepID=UPI002041837E